MRNRDEQPRKFAIGDRVRKHSGSWWEGRVVGFYGTSQTAIGYNVQLDMVPNGPVQIYPEAALESAAALSEQTLPVRVEIKPLEWSDAGSGRWRGAAKTGSYEVWHQWASDGKFHVSVHLAAYTGVMVGSGFPTLEAAKAAAQQDYETRIRSALVDNSHASEAVVESLDDRMKAAGMYTVSEMMGVTPLTKWMSNPAINTIEAFSEWLDRKVSEYLRMKAAYDLGDKDESDELYEWVQAHSAVYSTIRDQFQVVLSSLRPAEVGSATSSSGVDRSQHHPLCSVQKGGYCDYDCPRDYTPPEASE